MVRRTRLALLLALVASLVPFAAACGTGESGSGSATATAATGAVPAPADLAAGALEALERERSAHYALDMTLEVDAPEGAESSPTGPISLHVEGDADEEAVTADVAVEVAADRFTARLLARPHELYVQLMGVWYGGDLPDSGSGIDERLATPGRVRRHFEDVFVGEVAPGPLVDGQATWSYEGTLDPERLRELVQSSGDALSAEERRQLEDLAHAAALRFLVGREDSLPRRIELDLDVDLAALDGTFAPPGRVRASVVLRLSEFGKPVVLEPPAHFRPLEELAAAFSAAPSSAAVRPG